MSMNLKAIFLPVHI